MNRNAKGFTLIELVVVIAILGILAAVALPKFVNLTSQARIANVNAARGSLNSAASMAHAYWLTAGSPATMTAEGVVVTYSVAAASGYPKADANFGLAAGLTAADYVVTVAGTTLTAAPVSAGANCKVTYTEPAAVNTAPTIAVTTAGC